MAENIARGRLLLEITFPLEQLRIHSRPLFRELNAAYRRQPYWLKITYCSCSRAEKNCQIKFIARYKDTFHAKRHGVPDKRLIELFSNKHCMFIYFDVENQCDDILSHV